MATKTLWINYFTWGLGEARGYEITLKRIVPGQTTPRIKTYHATESSALRVMHLARELVARHSWYVNPLYAGWAAYSPDSWRPPGFTLSARRSDDGRANDL